LSQHPADRDRGRRGALLLGDCLDFVQELEVLSQRQLPAPKYEHSGSETYLVKDVWLEAREVAEHAILGKILKLLDLTSLSHN
jgi:hypothetical protein